MSSRPKSIPSKDSAPPPVQQSPPLNDSKAEIIQVPQIHPTKKTAFQRVFTRKFQRYSGKDAFYSYNWFCPSCHKALSLISPKPPAPNTLFCSAECVSLSALEHL